MRRIYQYRDRTGADQFGRKLSAGIERGEADALAVEAARGAVKDYWGLIAHFAHVLEPSRCASLLSSNHSLSYRTLDTCSADEMLV